MTAARAHRDRLVGVFVLTAAVLVIEIVGGDLTDSLALLADAGHLLTDTVGIGLALGAIWFAGRPPTEARTFGYLRLEILAAVANAVLLLGIAVIVVVEAIRRLADPPDILAGPMLVIALIGGVANLIGHAPATPPQRDSLNMRGAYLEVLSDLLGSIAVVIAAIVILLTGWTPIDALASLAIGALILPRTLRLLREAVDVLLEASPKGLDIDDVRRHILDAPGVADVHDLHAWTITSGSTSCPPTSSSSPGRPTGRPRRAVPLSVRRLRHRALHVPARDDRPAATGGASPRLTRPPQRPGARPRTAGPAVSSPRDHRRPADPRPPPRPGRADAPDAETPILVRQMRNGIEESVHRGDIVEADAAGRIIRQLGDPDRLVTLRSTVKPFGVVALHRSRWHRGVRPRARRDRDHGQLAQRRGHPRPDPPGAVPPGRASARPCWPAATRACPSTR